jgi:Bifunctional DNA primase/polymerase, N-terminal
MTVPHTPAGVRRQLRIAGFSPLPLSGKAPVLEAWQKHHDTADHEIEWWSRTHPAATNTGVLTRLTPTLDIDIRDPDAAAAVERLVRCRFEDKGRILVRFGNAPKRCIPFQTIEPFPKILRLFGEADTPVKDCEKLEFLCDGQQVVVYGVHPDTGKPYSWFDGAPGEVRHEELPLISAEEAQVLVDDTARVLVEKFGYRRKAPRPSSNGVGGGEHRPIGASPRTC